MVQITYPDTVPEELYNLTQLANVTLAAGKLSTTNIHQIKAYIQSDNKQIVSQNTCTTTSTTSSSSTILNSTIDKFHHSNNCIKSEHNNTLSLYTSHSYPTKKSENIEMITNDKHQHSVIKSTISCDVSLSLAGEFPHMLSRKNSLTEKKMTKSLSSSEDDSTYQNYSHKIFDKRRARKLSYQSDDSGFDIYNNRSSNYINGEGYFGIGNDDGSGGGDGGGGIDEIRETDDSMMSNSETDSTGFADGCKIIDANGEDVHVCPECSKKYSTSSNLARHRQTHRSLMDKKARRCPHCDKVYVSMPAFSMHVRTHNQGCECPHCGKRFSRPWLLQGHIRTHTGEKPFQCSICAKAFADKSNLRAHVQTHSNTKPHTCGRCGKAFALKSYLYKHEESSCMRNHTIKPTYERTPNSGNKLPKPSTNNIIAKIMKKNRLSNPPENKSNISKEKTQKSHKIIHESIVMDYGSKKSYMDLTEKPHTYPSDDQTPKEHEHFSRISVIRSAISTANAMPSTNISDHQSSNICYDDDLSMGFYQEKPMDFSPRNKYQNSAGGIVLSNKFDISTRNYALVV